MTNYRSISWPRVIVTGVLMFLLLFGCLWLVDLRFIPGTYERIFQSPISSIQRVQIYPRTNLPLINQNVTVIDSVPIQKIMIAIRSARPYSPNHPADRWTCELIISNSSGESYIRIADTLGEGTILYCAGGPFRSDTLGDILEKVVAKK